MKARKIKYQRSAGEWVLDIVKVLFLTNLLGLDCCLDPRSDRS